MRVLITGVGGQDGSYLAELCRGLGDDVHGVVRSVGARAHEEVRIHDVNLMDARATAGLIEALQPDRVFHLAGESFIGASEAMGMGFNTASTMTLLEGITAHAPKARLLLAGSAMQFAGADASPQNEETQPAPTSVYGLSKMLAAHAVRFFREQRGLHASTAILYNHESPRRPPHFLSRKLARAAVRIARGEESFVELGDLDAQRDWGWAPEYVEAMRRMLELPEPEDLILATGVARTVRDMANAAFAAVQLDGARHIRVRDDLKRAPDRTPLIGDARRARERLGWVPSVDLEEIMARMVRAELEQTIP